MKVKPILFNTEMVRAIQEARKTVTRRVLKPQPTEYLTCGPNWKELLDAAAAPVHPGDILWVRETWRVLEAGYPPSHSIVEYKAGGTEKFREIVALPTANGEWHPSIHMPKEAARMFLRVTDVRVERLQDMRLIDCEKEGVRLSSYEQADLVVQGLRARERFSGVWDATIRRLDLPRYGWEANPWVWVIEFERCEKPLDWQEEAGRAAGE